LRFLIAGAKGQLGIALHRKFSRAQSGNQVVALDRASLDVSSAAECAAAIEKFRPDVVLNCAAYTAVDRAESETALAYAINANGPKNLALACEANGAFLVHFSTDYVFDGASTRAYCESDATKPLGVYGASKLEGEHAVLANTRSAIVLRLSWVYSNEGANFYKTMLRLAAERPLLRVVADQLGIPNYTGDIADAVAAMFVSGIRPPITQSGTYHLSATGLTSWYQFACDIIKQANLPTAATVEAITTEQFPTVVTRPAFSALDSSRFATTFNWSTPTWQDGLRRCLAERALSA
jgi:dTDP-4-dehydrorhamnose reductase